MKYEIRLTKAAAADLDNIYEYIIEQFGKKVADKSIKKIVLAYKSLEDFPKKDMLQVSDCLLFLLIITFWH